MSKKNTVDDNIVSPIRVSSIREFQHEVKIVLSICEYQYEVKIVLAIPDYQHEVKKVNNKKEVKINV